MRDKLWFTGLPISVPIGCVLAYSYGFLMSCLRSIKRYGLLDMGYMGVQREDVPAMLLLLFTTVAVMFLLNLKKWIIDRQTDFNPFRNLLVSSLSDDKRRAQNNPVPKEYLSSVPDELTVGRYHRKYVRLPFLKSPLHQFILGPPGTRKTSVLLSALIYHFNYGFPNFKSVLAVDAKPELARKSVRIDRGDVIVIDPTSYDSAGFNVWYSLDQSPSDDKLKERATVIAKSLIPDLSADNAHFSTNAQNLFIGFVMYGFRKRLSFCDSVVKIQRANIQDLIAEVCTDPDMKNHEKIVGMVSPYRDNESDEFKSIEDTLRQNLTIFDINTVRYCLSENKRMATPHDLLAGKSIFLSIPDSLIDQYSRLFGMIMELCIKEIMSMDEYELRDEPPIWLLCDEAGSIYVPSLSSAVNRARSKHLQVSVVCQDYSQFCELYGEYKATSIYAGCKTKIILGCDDVGKARDISAQIGNYREMKVTDHQASGIFKSPMGSRNVTEDYRPIMDVSDIFRLEDNNQVLVLTRGRWFLVDKITYKDIHEYKELSAEIEDYNASLRQDVSDVPLDIMSDNHELSQSERILQMLKKYEDPADK